MTVVATKVDKSGFVVCILTSGDKKQFFAKRKKFWIAYDKSARCALNCSNDLKYLLKIFADM